MTALIIFKLTSLLSHQWMTRASYTDSQQTFQTMEHKGAKPMS